MLRPDGRPATSASAILPDIQDARREIAALGIRLGAPLRLERRTGSTNDDAKQGAREGEPHGAVWVAEEQTSGRGRQGRSWFGVPGESLLFSVLLRIPCPPVRVPPLALVVGLAVRDAIASFVDDASVLLKWPNDVVIAGPDGRLRKLAGVLVESQLSSRAVESIVCGVGINVHTRAFPEPLAAIATSIALARDALGAGALAASGPPRIPPDPPSRAVLLARALAALDRDVEHAAHRGLGLVHARLGRVDALRGRAVTCGDVAGVAAGIDLEGRLLVRRADGIAVPVASGEAVLSVRGPSLASGPSD